MPMKLFTPYRIRGTEFKNRVILPAMGSKMADANGFVTDRLVAYLAARAKGGCGLITTEVCTVHRTARSPHFLAIYEDCYIDGLRRIADACHRNDAKACLQLWHGGVIGCFPEQVSPSPYTLQQPGAVPSRELTLDEIHEIIEAYGFAAERAVKAGFDCVEFHAAHGYLPEEFLSPHFNRRTDEYGGSFENRARFSLEAIDSIRAHIPADMPLLMRVLPVEDMDGGYPHEESVKMCCLAREHGVDLLNVSRGVAASAAVVYEVPPVDIARGFNVSNATLMRKETALPVAAVGRINDPLQAEAILQDNLADMIVIGRAQLADPEFCNKAREGRFDDIIRCVGCNQGCYDGFVDPSMPHITCMRNPMCGEEETDTITQTDTPKKILIAGGGCGGLEAALVLKERGHNPVLYEAADSLGGQFVTAGLAPRKEEMKAGALQMVRMAERAGIEIHTNTPVTKELLEQIRPDEVIAAIGSAPMNLPVKGADLPHVYSYRQILTGEIEPKGCVAVIGGGLVGVETADKIIDSRCEVKIIEMLPQIATDLGMLRNIVTMSLIYGGGIPVYTNSKCLEIREHSIIVEQEGREVEIEGINQVVIAVGTKARNSEEIQNACKDLSIPCHIIGDAKKARRALNAIHEGFQVAREL